MVMEVGLERRARGPRKLSSPRGAGIISAAAAASVIRERSGARHGTSAENHRRRRYAGCRGARLPAARALPIAMTVSASDASTSSSAERERCRLRRLTSQSASTSRPRAALCARRFTSHAATSTVGMAMTLPRARCRGRFQPAMLVRERNGNLRGARND